MRLALLLLALSVFSTLAQGEPQGSLPVGSGPASSNASGEGEPNQVEPEASEAQEAEEGKRAEEGPPRWLWFVLIATGTLSLGGRLVMPLLLWGTRRSRSD